jgi:hypothetical protein
MFKRLLQSIFAPRTAADELRGMSDYELKDLGIGRSQVDYFCACEQRLVLDQPPCGCRVKPGMTANYLALKSWA